MSTNFSIQGTTDRLNTDGFFIVQLNPADIKKENLHANNDIIVSNEVNGFTFKVKARLQAYSKVEVGTICLDQKIRMAIGVDNKMGAVTLETSGGILENPRPCYEQFFGKQLNVLRVRKATFTDMEINVCRLPDVVMKSIGVEEGDRIIVESTKRRIQIRALELTEEIHASRIKREKDVDSRYYSAKDPRILALQKGNKLDYDLRWILLDLDARSKLGIQAYDPVTVYRSNNYAIKTKMHSITLPMVAGVVGFVLSLDYLLKDIVPVPLIAAIKAVLYASGLLFTIWLNLLPIRNKFK